MSSGHEGPSAHLDLPRTRPPRRTGRSSWIFTTSCRRTIRTNVTVDALVAAGLPAVVVLPAAPPHPTTSFPALSHLECSRDGSRHDADVVQGTSPLGAPLLARYDLQRAAATVTPAEIGARPPDLWRYHELLPV